MSRSQKSKNNDTSKERVAGIVMNCQMCGQRVSVYSGSEGTSSYTPVAEIECEKLRERMMKAENAFELRNAEASIIEKEREAARAEVEKMRATWLPIENQERLADHLKKNAEWKDLVAERDAARAELHKRLVKEYDQRLEAEAAAYREALEYIVQHEWAAEKPKWGNEFVEIARGALSRWGALGGGGKP